MFSTDSGCTSQSLMPVVSDVSVYMKLFTQGVPVVSTYLFTESKIWGLVTNIVYDSEYIWHLFPHSFENFHDCRKENLTFFSNGELKREVGLTRA